LPSSQEPNKGIAQQIAEKLAAKGFTVLVGARSLTNGESAIEGMEGDAKAIQLDVRLAARTLQKCSYCRISQITSE
jgi:NADP-dependent 3-hydroxy acid dehydrogenase YdfG